MNKLSESARKIGLPYRSALFWDADPADIDPKRHAKYIIGRVLDLGNEKEVRWLFKSYPRKLIKQTLETSRGVIHDKSKALWSLVLR